MISIDLLFYLKMVLGFIYLNIHHSGLKESIDRLHQNSNTRNLILIILPIGVEDYNERPTLRTFTQIVARGVGGNHRKDELQKKCYTKFCSSLYKEEKHGKIRWEVTLEELSKKYNIPLNQIKPFGNLTNEELLNLIFLSHIKGLHNDVVREFIYNPLFFKRFNYKFLSAVVFEMHEQTRRELEENFLERLKNEPIRIVFEDMVDENGNKRKSFKLPWTKAQNIESMIRFLEKIKFIADHEEQSLELKEASDHLKSLIARFEKALADPLNFIEYFCLGSLK